MTIILLKTYEGLNRIPDILAYLDPRGATAGGDAIGVTGRTNHTAPPGRWIAAYA